MNKQEHQQFKATVKRINCSKCGELMAKFYPFSSIDVAPTMIIPPCGKCIKKENKIKSK